MNEPRREAQLTQVRVRDAFWSARQRLMTDVAIPYMERVLRDEEPGAPRSHAIANFRVAAGLETGDFYGMVFQDSDVAKWLEAASYALAIKPDPALDARLDAVIDVIAKAQSADGYLNTYFTLREPGARWTNFLECHELYCAGHMLEAGVAHWECTGKPHLLSVAVRLADHICEMFGASGREAISGHQEIEVGLLRLYRATGKPRYRDMALRFLNLRGQNPDYFVQNTPPHEGISYGDYPIDPSDAVYNQNDVSVRAQDRPRGHAVRCLYMLAAMADAARGGGDEDMAEACRRVFLRIVSRQMYVTGALGATAEHEAFTVDWHLPANTVYGETCASVAMAFFMKNMLLMEPDGRYADVLELELYNGALAGMSLDGRRYFYVNPLETDTRFAGITPDCRHVKPERLAWYGCACCPPNLARLITSLGKLMWSEDSDTLYSHLFIGGQADMTLARVELTTGYPNTGIAEYAVSPRDKAAFALAIHIPAHVRARTLAVNGAAAQGDMKNGYLYLRRTWSEGDRVTLAFDMEPRRIYGNPRVRDCAGRVALARGPLIYCVESADHPGVPLHALVLPEQAEIVSETCADARLGDMMVLKAQGLRETARDALYSDATPRFEPVTLTAIPYYAWGNRGAGDMLVWVRA